MKGCKRQFCKQLLCKCRCKIEIKKIAIIMMCTGAVALLILCLPPIAWFIVLAILMIYLGVQLFRT